MKKFLSSLLALSLLVMLSCTNRNPLNSGSVNSASDTLALISKIDSYKKMGYPMTDYHAHLKGGLTIEGLMDHSAKTGISYGVAVNCGLGFPVSNDSAMMENFRFLQPHPVYKALQAEGREWRTLVSPDSVKMYDYVFTDAMTFTDDKGRRMRLWINEEVWVDDKQVFMETLVERIVGIMENEPVDIYVNPTFLPEVISKQYDELWTEKRMDRVIAAAVKNNIAIEINCRYKIPSAAFIKKAKESGVKFTMGTNNVDANIGYLEYGMEMIEECDLEPSDFWQGKKL